MGFDEITPRAHVPIGKGQRIIDVLHRECRERGIDIALGQRVDRLLVEDGEVCGVAVGGDEITAHAVVLASGGFGASDKKLEEFFPSAAATGRAWYIGADGSRGDAVDLAAQVDAQFIGHDRGLRLLDTGFDRVLEALVPSWMMLVDHDGRRFINEGAPYGLLDFAVRERGDSAFVIFDHGTLHGEAGQGHFEPVRPGNVRAPSPHWNPDTVKMMLAAGQVKSAETIAGLADELGLSPSTLTGSVERTMIASKSAKTCISRRARAPYFVSGRRRSTGRSSARPRCARLRTAPASPPTLRCSVAMIARSLVSTRRGSVPGAWWGLSTSAVAITTPTARLLATSLGRRPATPCLLNVEQAMAR